MKNSLIKMVVLLVSFAIAACSNMPGIYKADIKQGNYIDEARLARVVPGMAQREVQLILGTPLVNDSFNEHIWYYAYQYHLSNGKLIEERNVKVIFDNKKQVLRVE